jgi:hypothetical protein
MAAFLGIAMIVLSVVVLAWGFPRLPARNRTNL